MDITMLIHWIPDLGCAAVLLFFLIFGWRRGLLLALNRVIQFILSLYVAKVIADAFAPVFAKILTPKLIPIIVAKLTASTPSGGYTTNDLGLLKLIPEVARILNEMAGAMLESLAEAIAFALAKMIAWVVLFLVVFAVMWLVCKLLKVIFDLADKLPVIHFLNHLLGLLLGAAEGILVIVIVCWILDRVGVLTPEMVEDTCLLSFVLNLWK